MNRAELGLLSSLVGGSVLLVTNLIRAYQNGELTITLNNGKVELQYDGKIIQNANATFVLPDLTHGLNKVDKVAKDLIDME